MSPGKDFEAWRSIRHFGEVVPDFFGSTANACDSEEEKSRHQRKGKVNLGISLSGKRAALDRAGMEVAPTAFY